jgi:hypothetical protein
MSQQDFLAALGSIFIPGTAQLQRLYGLTAYLPTVMPLDKPEGVPDEIALVFYESQQSYNDTKLTVVGRAYSSLHATVFALPQSESGFPILLDHTLQFDVPYHVFEESVDWQFGFTQVFVGTRPDARTPERFAAGLFRYLDGLRQRRPKGLDGVVVCAREGWVLYWEHWVDEEASLHGRIADLPKLANRVLLQPYAPKRIPTELAGHYEGLPIAGGESYNIEFPRESGAGKTAPRTQVKTSRHPRPKPGGRRPSRR